jgi:hypothetical protein
MELCMYDARTLGDLLHRCFVMLGRPENNGSERHSFPIPWRASVSQRDPIEWRRNGDCRTHRESHKTGNLERPERLQAAAPHVTHIA